MFRSSNDLLLAKEKFKSETSIDDHNKNAIIYEEHVKVKAKHLSLVRSGSKTKHQDDGGAKTGFRHSMSTFPSQYNHLEQKQLAAIRKVCSLENPFSFSEDPCLVQQRLQTLGTSDLQALPWTELEENGTMYNTLLKKVRYKSDLPDDEAEEVNCKQWEIVKVKQMKAATLEKLVEHLTPVSQEVSDFDPGFFLAFLCTFKSFTTTVAVVDLLLKRFQYFESSPTESARDRDGVIKRICSVVTIWIDQYPRDFDELPNYTALNQLIKFSSKRVHIPTVEKLHNLCQNKLNTLTVSPFEDEKPLPFKYCSCLSVVGCTCKSQNNNSNEDDENFDIVSYAPDLVATQLTLIDAELFLRVVPRECLASFWSKRDASKGSKAQSIKLTVEQFNAVSLRVISTVLNARGKKNREYSTTARAKAITQWIDIAIELRELKNFSSLKAVISGLQSSAIYRLTRSWELVSKQTKEIYEGLSDIFSGEMNNKAFRELLVQEGTAKYSTFSKVPLKGTKSKRHSCMTEGRTYGTVPYLGTFLTDLTMIDTAFPNIIKDDLINFEKRRKEFEIVAQIKLLQQAAKNYVLYPDQEFCMWFNRIKTYGDKEGYERSLVVEPKITTDGITPSPIRKQFSLKKYLSDSDLRSVKTSKKESPPSTLNNRDDEDSETSSADDSSSVGSALSLRRSRLDSLNSNLSMNLQSLFVRPSSKVESLCSRTSFDPDDKPSLDNNGVIARVFLEGVNDAQYKSIMIKPNDQAFDVIISTLRKFNSSNDYREYSLYQITDSKSTFHSTFQHIRTKKSLYIPMNSNMYYAMTKKDDLCFKISKKKLSKEDRKLLGLAENKSIENHDGSVLNISVTSAP